MNIEMPQSNTTRSSSANTQSTGTSMSFNQMVREAGFTSFNQFMLSYGLKLSNSEDVEEGKTILKALFQDRR